MPSILGWLMTGMLLGPNAFVSLMFAIAFCFADMPVYLAFVFGDIALATAPAPALSIV